VGRRARLDGA